MIASPALEIPPITDIPLRVGQYRFNCRFLDSAILPPYKGSTFRGVFGHALRKVVCVLRTQNCSTCLLKNSCLYPFIFESGSEGNQYQGSALTSVPPYLIKPSRDTKTDYKPGEDFSFDLLLFGTVNDSLPHVLYAFIEVGKRGIGKKVNGRAAAFDVVSVCSEGSIIYSLDSQTLTPSSFGKNIYVENSIEKTNNSSQPDKLKIQLITPLRVKLFNQFQVELPFHVLIRAVLRRISGLWASHAGCEPPLPYTELVKAAYAIDISDNNLRWFDWHRYSSRQDQKMLMGGLVGDVAYQGNLAPFVPYLRLAEMFNIGKQTTFGLGAFSLEEIL